jgi:hypothetical protein
LKLSKSVWSVPCLPEFMAGPLDIDTLSDDSESDTDDPDSRFRPTMSMARDLFVAPPSAAPPAAAAATAPAAPGGKAPAKGGAPAAGKGGAAAPAAAAAAAAPVAATPARGGDGAAGLAVVSSADADSGTRAAVPWVTSEMPRDRARLAMCRKERAAAASAADWMDSRLDTVDQAVVDPAAALAFSAV